MQLTGNDKKKFLASLAARAVGLTLPIASLSGGRNYLDFGSGRFAGRSRNIVLQRLIGETPNDGLVAESSSNAHTALGSANARHHSKYGDYPKITKPLDP